MSGGYAGCPGRKASKSGAKTAQIAARRAGTPFQAP